MWQVISSISKVIIHLGLVLSWIFLTILYFYSINQVLSMCKKFMADNNDNYNINTNDLNIYNGFKFILFTMGWVNIFNLVRHIFIHISNH